MKVCSCSLLSFREGGTSKVTCSEIYHTCHTMMFDITHTPRLGSISPFPTAMATSGPVSGIDPNVATSLHQQCSNHVQAYRPHYLTERFSEPFFRLFMTESREVQSALNEFFTVGTITSQWII